MAANDELEPIFLIGAPRSGTGILQNVLRLHPEVAWVTPASNAMTGFVAQRGLPLAPAFLAARVLDPISTWIPDDYLPRFLQGPFDGSITDDPYPVAVEGSRIWCWHFPDRDHDRVTAEDVTEEARAFYRAVVQRHTDRFDGAERFLEKRPQNSLRIPYIEEIFPRATFIHLIRDGRAVTSSMLKRRQANPDDEWFGVKPPGWRATLDSPVVAQCAWEWATSLEIILQDLAASTSQRTIEVRYEELTEDAHGTVERVIDALGLTTGAVGASVEPYLDQLENRNHKWRDQLDDKQRAQLQDAAGAMLDRLGYEPASP